MQQYNNLIRMRDLFMNPQLDGVFPQFTPNKQSQNMDLLTQTEELVRDYLVTTLNGKVTADGDIVVGGEKKTVLIQVRDAQDVIEGFISDMPKVVQALRKNTPLYLPYATLKQLEKTESTTAKIKAMREVMDNFQYNPDMGALNSVKNENPEQFAKNKKAWEKKVGYRRIKRA